MKKVKRDKIFVFYEELKLELEMKTNYCQKIDLELKQLIYKAGPKEVTAADYELINSSSYDGTSPIELYKEVYRLQSILNSYKNDIASLKEYIQAVEKQIKMFANTMNDLEAKVFYYHHIKGWTLDKVAIKLNYSKRQIARISSSINNKLKEAKSD